MLKGFNKRLKALEEALPLSAELDSATIYTLGPASGTYDIEWSALLNASASVGRPPKLIVIGAVVHWQGLISFAAAPDGDLYPHFVLPEELWPTATTEILMRFFSATGNVTGIARVTIDPDPEEGVVFSPVVPSSTAIGAGGGALYLSGSHVAGI